MLKTVLAFLTALALSTLVHAEVLFTFDRASQSFLDNPHDLKLSPDGTLLFVSDVGNNRIALLDPETLNLVGAFGADHQSGTHDIDFDKDGRAYVADTHNNRIAVYTMDGTEATLIAGLSDDFRGPEGVLVHSNGRLYVAGAWSHSVVAYDNAERVATLETGLAAPHDLEETPEGDIWVADSDNDRMLLLSPDLAAKKEWSGADYDFNGVRYMDVLPDGTVIAADKNNHVVKVISADGRLLATLGSGKRERGPGRFATPEGVEVRGNTLWISDSGNDRVVKYTFEIE